MLQLFSDKKNLVTLSYFLFHLYGIIKYSEYLLSWKLYSKGGTCSWEIIKDRPGRINHFVIKYFSLLLTNNAFFSITALSFLIHGILIFNISYTVPFFFWLFLICAQLIISFRNRYDGIAADYLYTILVLPLGLLNSFRNDNIIETICMSFIAIQTVIAYFTAGIVKLLTIHWRNGSALPKILNMELSLLKPLALFLHQHKLVSQVISFILIVLLMSVPVVIFLPTIFVVAVLFLLLLFHILNLFILHINQFIFA